MRELLNCPNCGAPITGVQCEYCGTVFYDFTTMEVGKTQHVRVKIKDELFIFNAAIETFDVEISNHAEILYADGAPYYISNPQEIELKLSMRSVPDDRGVLFSRRAYAEGYGHE